MGDIMTMTETPNGRATLKNFQCVVEAFRRMKPTMTVQQLFAFVLVANNEGLSVDTYARLAGMSAAVMSRHLQDLGQRDRYMKPGLGLIFGKAVYTDLRRQEVHLTDKGKSLVRKILKICEVEDDDCQPKLV